MALSTDYLNINEEVSEALFQGRAVVALESTIIAHGMPYPQNLATALELEAEVRSCGAVPATIAVMDGSIKVGMTKSEIERIASATEVLKASRLDLPYVISNKKVAATTVASTMIGAEAAGIKFFATGGAGGVHRGVKESLDISADMIEFSKTDVAVISAGVKAILDIPKTLELFETLGVPVIGYQIDDFPAFYSRSSGQRVHYRLDSEDEIAAFAHAKWKMGLQGGILVANPVPRQDEIERSEIEPVIESAMREAEEKGIRGKELTPYLLSRLKEKTSGRSLSSNISLVKSNASLAARVAVSFSNLKD